LSISEVLAVTDKQRESSFFFFFKSTQKSLELGLETVTVLYTCEDETCHIK